MPPSGSKWLCLLAHADKHGGVDVGGLFTAPKHGVQQVIAPVGDARHSVDAEVAPPQLRGMTMTAHTQGTDDAAVRPGGATQLAVVAMVGTTVVNDGLVENALSRTLQGEGISAGSAQLGSMLAHASAVSGTPRIDILRSFFADDDQAHRANRAFELHCDELISDGGILPVPGAEDALCALRSANIQICLATGFGRHTQNVLLESLGWMGLADLSLCPSDAGRGRPYPDMILTAVLALDIDDVRSVAVVGGSVADMKSGIRAGAGTVLGVLTGAHGDAKLRSAGARAVVDSIRDVPGYLLAGSR